MLISIIMPVYNPEFSDLNKAILSCINQTYQNWELCICDDGSTKPYVKPLIKKYMQKDKRIKSVFSDKNEHICVASNKAISLAKGDYIGFLDHDDILDKKALEEVADSIKKNNSDIIYTDEAILNKNKFKLPVFKPDFDPETLMSCNYIIHFIVIKKEILKKIGGFEVGTDGAQDYDLILKGSEITKNIHHIPKILYYWRKSKQSVLSNPKNKPYVISAGRKVLESALKRRSITGKVTFTPYTGIYQVKYVLKGNPLVSIIIPFKDKLNLTKKCIQSIITNTTYPNYEIILINNKSSEKETIVFLNKLKYNKKIKILNYFEKFNFSKINNYASKFANGEYLLFLNNDTQILRNGWLEEMLSVCQQKKVGIVGAKMIFPNKKIQHGGISFNQKIGFYQAYYNFNDVDMGYNSHNLTYRRNCIAVLGACMIIKKGLFKSLNGFDESLAVEKNDIDLCLRVRQKGYQIIFTPFTRIIHNESSSRKGIKVSKDNKYFWKKWKYLKKDPFTNGNITLDREFISQNSPYFRYYKNIYRKKFYVVPFYCLKEQGWVYTIKRIQDFALNPKLISRLIKSNH